MGNYTNDYTGLDGHKRRKHRRSRRNRRLRRKKRQQAALFIIIAIVVVVVLILVGVRIFGHSKNVTDPGAGGGTTPVSEDAPATVSEGALDPVSGDSAAQVSGNEAQPVTYDSEYARRIGAFTDRILSANEALHAYNDKLAAPFYQGYTTYADDDTKGVPAENVVSKHVVLIDMKTGHVVAQRDADSIIYPASMTKVLTVLTASEILNENDADMEDTFEITQDITNFVFSNGCSAVCYDVGEKVPVGELFYGTILPSGGDAALGLAYYSCGSVDEFVDRMNEKVSELGLSSTAHFANPVGIFDENNKCTVKDIAMIMKAALEDVRCYDALSEHKMMTSATPEHPDGIEISNWFLRRIEDRYMPGVVVAAKTGFIKESGNCAVSYFEADDGGQYICVTADSTSSWRAIYDHAVIYNLFCGDGSEESRAEIEAHLVDLTAVEE